MFNLFRYGIHFGPQQQPRPQFSTGLLLNGLLCVLFGLAIIANPDLVAYFVAFALLFLGASLLTAWWRTRQ
ncbi:hypothetical protein COU80_06185 [Candidatus Peregrinibacteria bacterium CG10_big_fil_rev_8_21_14_0_10_55_24]|nr:MAG: hypothetical protein COU80_06185 [Candidatus Peregrinibacteria bacterium CG10_big_fil_rev_8_21_14_0_10_55_24]